jgi:hypothetical protein
MADACGALAWRVTCRALPLRVARGALLQRVTSVIQRPAAMPHMGGRRGGQRAVTCPKGVTDGEPWLAEGRRRGLGCRQGNECCISRLYITHIINHLGMQSRSAGLQPGSLWLSGD